MLAEFSIVPLGKGEGVSQYVAECLRVVEGSGVEYRVNPMGTVLEGDFDEVMAVICECHKRVASMASRVLTTVRIDDRRGVEGALDSKVRSVEQKLGVELRK